MPIPIIILPNIGIDQTALNLLFNNLNLKRNMFNYMKTKAGRYTTNTVPGRDALGYAL